MVIYGLFGELDVHTFTKMFTEGIMENSLVWIGVFTVTIVAAGLYITFMYARGGN